MRTLAAAVACCASLAAADGDVLWQVGITGGIAPGVIEGTVPVRNDMLGSVDYELSSTYRGGYGVGIGITRVGVDHDGDGWYLGFSQDAVRWLGSIDEVAVTDARGSSDARISVSAIMYNLGVGYTKRWDGDILHVMPRDWQLDIGPMAGIGMAAVAIEGSATSDQGLAWQAGLHTRLTASLGDAWRLGGQCDLLYGQATVAWDNTGDATITALGPAIAVVLLREF